MNLTVTRGEFVTLVGPSGCGKSTLLNMTAGLFHPTDRSVRYDRQEVTAYNLRTGYMTQNDHLLPWRDVVGNIAVPLEIAGLARGEACATGSGSCSSWSGWPGFEKSYPSQLSGGMRKRTALARLLAYDPETLLLDEPFAALDAQLRLNMQIELLRHKPRGSARPSCSLPTTWTRRWRWPTASSVFTPRPGTIRRDRGIAAAASARPAAAAA